MIMSSYRGKTLPPAPPPPPPPLQSDVKSKSRTLSGRYFSSGYSSSSPATTNANITSTDPNNNSNKNRSCSTSNVSRISNSIHSTDSNNVSCSSSNSSGSSNLDTESTTPPYSLSPTSRLLDELETSKIEMFYRSHRTFVYVGQCLASLFFTETELVDGGRLSRPKSDDWKLVCSGVPVLLFNRGDTKSRDKRQIRVCIAEHGTGFQLWSDLIDNLSNYQPLKPIFHTMYWSTDHRKMAGFKFENQFAALEFYRQIEIIVANPLNISLSGPNKKKNAAISSSNPSEKFKLFRRQRSKSVGRSSDVHRKDPSYQDVEHHFDNGQKSGKNRRQPGKSDISAPCLFQHVTSVNLSNFDHHGPRPPLAQPEETLEPLVSGQQQPRHPTNSSDYSTPFHLGQHHRRNHSALGNSTSA